MKKDILTLVFTLLPMLFFAQERDLIQVLGRTSFVDPEPRYQSYIALSLDQANTDGTAENLDQLKEEFKQVLEQKGLSWDSVKETPNTFGYETLNYLKEGIIYEFNTASAEQMKRFMTLRMTGLSRLMSSAIIVIDMDEAKTISEKAIKNAEQKAQIIATASGRKLGKIAHIEEQYSLIDEEIKTSIYFDRPGNEFFYNINVTYTLK